MGLFDRLFGRQPAAGSDPLLGKALDRTVEVVEPKLALVRDWRNRLAPGVTAAIGIARAGAVVVFGRPLVSRCPARLECLAAHRCWRRPLPAGNPRRD